MADTRKTKCRAALLVSFPLPDNFHETRLDLLSESERADLFLSLLQQSDDLHYGYGVKYAIDPVKEKNLREQNPDLTDEQIDQLADGHGYAQVINDMILLRLMGAAGSYRLAEGGDSTEPQG